MQADIRQVADSIHLVHGSNTNWVILTEGDSVTLVDTGLSRRPRDAPHLTVGRGRFGRVPQPHVRHAGLHPRGRSPAHPPGLPPWSGGTDHNPVTEPRPFPGEGALDLPGRPVPVHTPGHTAGHCAFHLPDAGIVISGDALVSGHPTSRAAGPQLLPDMFHRDRPGATSLDDFEALSGDVLLPGHGPVHRGSVREAAQRARAA